MVLSDEGATDSNGLCLIDPAMHGVLLDDDREDVEEEGEGEQEDPDHLRGTRGSFPPRCCLAHAMYPATAAPYVAL